ncbi:helix-turn-helix domain-containing protein [Nonomuraea sp. K274]|uniref:Helix-turn-helix domain-containing protein n=1 Tax=Nonomuraea cypriaca TaxID=1187855 RepID=A0A931A8J8_9ACTN|nr:helix-turn-helix domain-containing protein [Nonomuraea cypriaca]MBF8187168.1 helix-turn-helix domain-containing protein [Nonomuraea cypriaca]
MPSPAAVSHDAHVTNSVPYPIESVDNALRLIHLLRARGEVGVTAAAKALGVAPSTAHRLLAMLVFRGRRAERPPGLRPRPARPGCAGGAA